MGSWKRVGEGESHGVIVSDEREERNYVLKL